VNGQPDARPNREAPTLPDRMLLSGNEAVALAGKLCGIELAAGYPGTPSTEILEAFVHRFGGTGRWSPNEKVAMEVALGASIAGARTMVTMKHVGLNVAADPLFSAAHTGVRGAMVIVSADDPGMHSSQNEQDNRYYAQAAGIPLLEPADSHQAAELFCYAVRLSEEHGTPVLLRLTTRVCHSFSVVRPNDLPVPPEPRRPARFEKAPQQFVLVPAHARGAHERLLARLERLRGMAEACPHHRLHRGSNRLGIITNGIGWHYCREAAPEASVLQLAMSWPVPVDLVRKFAAEVEQLFVIEEGDDWLARQIRAEGIDAKGKPTAFRCGELSVERVRAILTGQPEPPKPGGGKPPVMCPGCPHRPVFMALRDLGAIVAGDIGCYTLGVLGPLNAMDTCICMGASIGVGLGMRAVVDEEQQNRIVSVIGDSTFFHSGLTGLLEMVYNGPASTLIILDNSTTAMTGHQDHPGTGRRLDGTASPRIDIPALCRAMGICDVRVLQRPGYRELKRTIQSAMQADHPVVIVVSAPCTLKVRLKQAPLTIDRELCRRCNLCVRTGCPAIEPTEVAPRILADLCVGCGLCAEVCPVGAIGPIDEAARQRSGMLGKAATDDVREPQK